MAADLLHDKRQELPPDDARAVELLQNQLNRFEALLADLLETSRQDSGSVQLDYEEVDLRAMSERVAGALEPLVAELDSPVEVIGLDSLVVPCDAQRVERILANLISNALEHGMGRPVVVEVMLEGDEAQLAVTDQGVGLTQQEITQVFTRFWRADPSRVRRVGGTGPGPVDRPG